MAGLTPEEVAETLQVASGPVSIHRPVGTETAELGDLIEDGDQADPGDAAGNILAGEALYNAPAALSNLERTVITLRYGFDTGRARMLADVLC